MSVSVSAASERARIGKNVDVITRYNGSSYCAMAVIELRREVKVAVASRIQQLSY